MFLKFRKSYLADIQKTCKNLTTNLGKILRSFETDSVDASELKEEREGGGKKRCVLAGRSALFTATSRLRRFSPADSSVPSVGVLSTDRCSSTCQRLSAAPLPLVPVSGPVDLGTDTLPPD